MIVFMNFCKMFGWIKLGLKIYEIKNYLKIKVNRFVV